MKKILASILLTVFAVLGASAEMVLPVDWTSSVNMADDTHGTVTLTAKIKAGYHIYGFEARPNGPHPTEIQFNAAAGVTFDDVIKPSVAATRYVDTFFNDEIEMWSGTVSFSRDFTLAAPGIKADITGKISYMACNDKSCQTLKCPFDLVVNPNGTSVKDSTAQNSTQASNEQSVKEAITLTDDGEFDIYAPVDTHTASTDGSWWYILLMGFVGGLLALLTPCVWPMIPMTLSFFLKKTKSRSRSIRDALTYGLSIIVIFLVLGLAITMLFGAGELNEIATGAVFNVIFFVILVVFAISFFGAFEIKLPSRWSNKMDNMADKTTGYLSIFFMAFTLVLVSFSCTGPIIGTLLVEAATNDSIIGPAAGMGGFALGLALPFTLFAFFPSILKEMPKSGGWMNSVKVVLGFIELILSLKFLSVADLAYGWHILDREVFISLWIVLFVLLGMYLLGKLRFPHDEPKTKTGVGSFFLATISFAFAVYMLPGLWGAPLKSISAFAPPLSTQDFNLYEGEIHEFNDYEEGMKYARDNNLPVMLDFSGYGCVNCRKMESAVFDTPQVREILNRNYVFIKLMVDNKADLPTPIKVTENGREDILTSFGEKWSYLQRHKFNTNSQPYYVILDGKGRLMEEPRVYDENVDAFIKWLEDGVAEFNEKSK